MNTRMNAVLFVIFMLALLWLVFTGLSLVFGALAFIAVLFIKLWPLWVAVVVIVAIMEGLQ